MNQQNKNNNSKFYKCGCSTHLLEIDTSFREEDGDTCFSIWELGRNVDKMTIRERIRWCWRILTTGSPWSDSVILNEEQVKEIVEQLTEDNEINDIVNELIRSSSNLPLTDPNEVDASIAQINVELKHIKQNANEIVYNDAIQRSSVWNKYKENVFGSNQKIKNKFMTKTSHYWTHELNGKLK